MVAVAEVEPNQRCVLRHRGGTRPFASLGLICRDHVADLYDLLADVAGLYAELPYAGEPLAVAGERSSHGKRSAKPGPAVPVNLTAFALTSSSTRPLGSVPVTEYLNGPRLESNGGDVPHVWEVLDAWCKRIAEERDSAVSYGGVASMVDALRRHLSWIVAQPWLRDFERELRACRQALAAAVGDDPMPAPFAECPYDGAFLWTDRDRAAIRLRRQGKDVEAAEGRTDRVQCDSCGKAWEGRNGLAQLLYIVRAELQKNLV